MRDPFLGLTFNSPYFTVEHYGGSTWRWERYTTFKYVKARQTFILHKDGHKFFQASSPNKVQTNIHTSKDLV